MVDDVAMNYSHPGVKMRDICNFGKGFGKGIGAYTGDAEHIWGMRSKIGPFWSSTSVLGDCVAIKSYIFIYKF